MATLLSYINSYIGTFSDTAALDNWLTQGARTILNVVPDDKLRQYALQVAIPSSGLANIDNYRVLKDSIYSGSNYSARQLSVGMFAEILNSDGIYYATTRDPIYIYTNGQLLMYANGVAIAGSLSGILFPNVTNTLTAIPAFPLSLVQAVVLYACIQATIQNVNSKIISVDGLTFSFPSVPVAPASPSFNFTSIADPTIIATNIVSPGNAPTYTAPVFSGSYNNFETQLGTNQDFELAKGYLDEVSNQLNQYATDIQNAYHTFEDSNVAYQATLQENIEQARLTQQRLMELSQENINVDTLNATKALEVEVSQYSATLQLFQHQLSSYQAQVGQEVQRVGTYISKYVQETTMLGGLLKSLQDEYTSILKNFIG